MKNVVTFLLLVFIALTVYRTYQHVKKYAPKEEHTHYNCNVEVIADVEAYEEMCWVELAKNVCHENAERIFCTQKGVTKLIRG